MRRDDRIADVSEIKITGIDVSALIEPPAFGESWESCIVGLKRAATVTISGRWDNGELTCPLCQREFVPSTNTPIPLAVATHRETGEQYQAPVCDDCAVKIADNPA